MVAVELEVLAKKFDRFGWDRDRGSMAHDRTITDWMDALHDYPLDEIQRACRTAVINRPNSMPNEGHIIAAIMEGRRKFILSNPKPEPDRTTPQERMTPERRKEIMAEVEKSHGKLKSFNAKATPATSEKG